MLVVLVLAAVLEIAGLAGLRRGLVHGSWPWAVLGGALLLGYGWVVNANRSIAFGRLMGLYIAIFFVVSQLLALGLFGERPPPSVILGGLLIVAGALVIQRGLA
jgi:drug/metabolite transporter superfamily protein YnfA